ncbi:radical SAM protein [Teredinibacter turnerae]|uniref:radical SAM protein n=1 Tax=Teredinibacter turnerae TaxID=2426 RepID=UPI0003FF7441|nr:radical SAM protein [Teredinibacter turnerae]
MTTLNDLVRKIQTLAEEIYPPDLSAAYSELENSLSDTRNAIKIAKKIKELKQTYKTKAYSIDWSDFFERITQDFKNGSSISIEDIIKLEYAPEDQADNVIELLNVVAANRATENNEAIRVCQSIYAFTTCLTPCNYGTYGSCIFVPKDNEETSVAERILGNINTVDEFVDAIKNKSYSNNRKLITTSRTITSHQFRVILNTIREIRASDDPHCRDLPMCVSLGSLNEDHIIQLKDAGATRINHNLETSYFNSLYLSAMSQMEDEQKPKKKTLDNEHKRRLSTLLTGLKNDIGFCSGGMLFYGDDEMVEDRILLYLTYRELDKIKGGNSSPFNVYVPLDEIVEKSSEWFSTFELPVIERKAQVDRYSILKTLLSFSLIVSSQHKIIVSAGSKWLGDEYYALAVKLSGGAGLANYLQQIDSETTKNVVDKLTREKFASSSPAAIPNQM